MNERKRRMNENQKVKKMKKRGKMNRKKRAVRRCRWRKQGSVKRQAR